MGVANRFPVSADSRAIGYSKQTDEKKPMIYMGFYQFLAEEAGFEPAVGITLRTLSRRVT